MEPNWKKRPNLTGKGATASFLSIPHWITDSVEFAALSGNELKMFMELARQYRGNNNGALSAMRGQLSARGWRNHDLISNKLKALEAKGWAIKTRQGGKHAGCTLYALTIWPIDDCGGKHDWPAERKASHLWRGKSESLISRHRRPAIPAARRLAA